MNEKLTAIGNGTSKFIDIITAGTGRASSQDKKSEQRELIKTAHDVMFNLNRSIYGAFVALEGNMDFHKQLAVELLLRNPYAKSTGNIFNSEQEYLLLKLLVSKMPITRVLKLFCELADKKINNSRMKRLIFDTIFLNENLEYWAVTYRKKLKKIIIHIIGTSGTYALKKILPKIYFDENGTQIWGLSAEENEILGKLFKGRGISNDVISIISFILGNENKSTELIDKYIASKIDIKKGKGLPLTTLRGIWGHYHKKKGVDKSVIFELSEKTMTEKQKKNIQNEIEKHSVEIEFNPNKISAVDLYLYCFEKGFTSEFEKILNKKAEKAAKEFPFKYDNIVIVEDCSYTMFGNITQKLRPAAIAHSITNVLKMTSKKWIYNHIGGYQKDREPVRRPGGATNIAGSIVNGIQDFQDNYGIENLDAIFIVTDGYENSPAGRSAEVISWINKKHPNVKIYQLSPVIGVESDGIRKIGNVTEMPISSDVLGIGVYLKPMLKSDPQKAIQLLFKRLEPHGIKQIEMGGLDEY